jgi:hypothetical protein
MMRLSKGTVVTKSMFFALTLGAASLGLPALALADDTMPPQQSSPPQVAAQPIQPGSDYLGNTNAPYNPNKVPPWSRLRNGNGDPIDPVYGLPAPGYGANSGS